MEIKSSFILLVLMTGLLTVPVSARRRGSTWHGRQRLPIKGDQEQHATRHEERRRKASGTPLFLLSKIEELENFARILCDLALKYLIC